MHRVRTYKEINSFTFQKYTFAPEIIKDRPSTHAVNNMLLLYYVGLRLHIALTDSSSLTNSSHSTLLHTTCASSVAREVNYSTGGNPPKYLPCNASNQALVMKMKILSLI